jgi:CheY-like chemotaxis protein
MDYHMHDMDGDECTRRIREYETMAESISHHVYIAGYTADVLEDSTGKLLSAGMNSVIPKPEPPRAVEDELRKMMEEYTKAGGKSED